MKSIFIRRCCVLLTMIFIIGLFATFIVIAQKIPPSDLRENLKLIETFDFTQNKKYQLIFTEKSELFLTTSNRLTKKWSYRKGNVQREFSVCENHAYIFDALNSDGNLLSVSCQDFSIEVWNLDDAKRITRFQVQKPKGSEYLVPYNE